jgi:hypothetical protein
MGEIKEDISIKNYSKKTIIHGNTMDNKAF